MYKLKQLPEDFVVQEIPILKTKDKGAYTYFILEKRDYDTEKAVNKISAILKIPRKNFSYAGNKDRHAITSQYVSVKGRIKNAELKDFIIKIAGYGDQPISLGELKGNKFKIVVRNINNKPRKIKSFINYFDEQRFGKHNIDIGLAIMQRNFSKAVGLIDSDEVKKHIAIYNQDYIGAIRKVPFNIMRLYLHSVQSWLWNNASASYIKNIAKEYNKIKYSGGYFIFPKKSIRNLSIPLLAFDTQFKNRNIEGIYTHIMKQQSISLRDFVIRSIPDITPSGGERELVAEVNNLKISELEDDELNKGRKKATVEFELGKGMYGTILIRQLFLE